MWPRRKPTDYSRETRAGSRKEKGMGKLKDCSREKTHHIEEAWMCVFPHAEL